MVLVVEKARGNVANSQLFIFKYLWAPWGLVSRICQSERGSFSGDGKEQIGFFSISRECKNWKFCQRDVRKQPASILNKSRQFHFLSVQYETDIQTIKFSVSFMICATVSAVPSTHSSVNEVNRVKIYIYKKLHIQASEDESDCLVINTSNVS